MTTVAAGDPGLVGTVQSAFSGDAPMARELAGVVGVYSVRLLVALLILAVTLWASKRLARLVHRAVDRLPHHHTADETLADFVSALVRYLVIAIGLIAILQQIGVQATSVLAVLGAASLAIGLALQGTLGNVAPGEMIVLLRPYRVGDKVELNGRQEGGRSRPFQHDGRRFRRTDPLPAQRQGVRRDDRQHEPVRPSTHRTRLRRR